MRLGGISCDGLASVHWQDDAAGLERAERRVGGRERTGDFGE